MLDVTNHVESSAAYVIALAGANEISAGAVGLVYLAAIVPCLFLKLSVPYWCDPACGPSLSAYD